MELKIGNLSKIMFSSLLKRFRQNIALHLLTTIFSFYFLVAVLVTVVQLYKEYEDTKAKFYKEIQTLPATFNRGIVDSVWTYNKELLQSILLGMHNLPIVVGIKVESIDHKMDFKIGAVLNEKNEISYYDSSGKITEQKEFGLGTNTLFKHEFPMEYTGVAFEQKVPLGQVTLYSNNQLVFDRVKYGFILILINSIIKTIALWFIIYYFIRKYLGQPLEEFTTKIRKQDIHSPQTIDLNIPWTDTNELFVLKDSYNQMITRLNKHKVLSITDKLTGVFNRLKLDEALNDEFNRSSRFKSNFGVIIIDIDYFKKINDTFGHLVGDQVLIEFAKILETNIRKIDVLGRWGGEEFMIICPETNFQGTIKVAQSLREIISEYEFLTVNKINASFGVSAYNKDDENIDKIIARADSALYKAKVNGRNRVEG
ncbi:GGDEF domain-containing protein [Arcobacter arenosus]|jgi:diguanylate cyclase (GGDEF)-like protein|uniref:diguanylate cyclase n=1 Tax=Arcobacter arenosus TaxID=2576037 RepID=A0A5R8XYU9_9BACT|nr:sensor domain-containing diguanylate cyclase [Arcobacter arenosus]TLP36187.1 diguanylate cyclase [Arcobacter arenosus]